MKVAYCIHSLHLSRGIERGVCSRTAYLSSIPGYEVYIITARLHGRDTAYPVDPKVKLIDLDASDRLYITYFRFRKKLWRCLEEIRPDVAVSVGDNGLWALSKAQISGIRIAEYHFSFEKFPAKYGRIFPGMIYARLRRSMVAGAASKMDAFVVLTKADREDWAGLVPGVRQIYNPQTILKEGHAPLDSKTIIAVGHLSPQKNYPDMLKAWETVAKRHPDWKLRIYGTGQLKSRLERTIRSKFPDGTVTLMGRSTEMDKVYLQGSALIMSSSYEGLPMVLLEASHFGVPAVSYDCPKGPAEIIDDGRSGFLVRMGDTDALAERICQLIENASLRKSMGAEAAGTSEKFRIESIMGEWIELFEYLCKENESNRKISA